MKYNFSKHLITSGSNLKTALRLIEELPEEGVLFIVTKKNILLGSLTDGDIRRAMINDRISLTTTVDEIMKRNPKFIVEDNYDVIEIIILSSATEMFPIISLICGLVIMLSVFEEFLLVVTISSSKSTYSFSTPSELLYFYFILF